MRLYLINPFNPMVSLTNVRQSRWNRYRVWKPLGLGVLAGLTPPDWDVTILDENLGLPAYDDLPRPDLVGITAFTSQAGRAYEVADLYRRKGVPVVMGGIHATMCTSEALGHVDTVVTGEAETVWPDVLEDCCRGQLEQVYSGGHVDMARVPRARHDLFGNGYAFGSVQTTRGCPLDCTFCSVSSFNGKRYRHRPIENVVEEIKHIRERWVLVVDDNLIGTSRKHVDRAKRLFAAMIEADLGKKWICQVTINMADDPELLDLAARAGCCGVFIGFESPTPQGLSEVGKKFNLMNDRDFSASVRQFHKRKILVVGSFIMGLDADRPGIGLLIARTAQDYGVDILNALFLTPLPGTRLWDSLRKQGRVGSNNLPGDWKYYTLGFPTARYKHFSRMDIIQEMKTCEKWFYSRTRIAARALKGLAKRQRPLLSFVSNMSYRRNAKLTHAMYDELNEYPSLPAPMGLSLQGT
jgi:radical SAM superfamily enzyme YgiQ (UPF0313 family)